MIVRAALSTATMVIAGGSAAASSAAVGCSAGAPVPAVTIAAATGVTASAATLRGTVNPDGCSTDYDFEYGTTTAYGATTTTHGVGAGTSSHTVAARITGLTPHTVYHFRIVAISGAGTAYGADQTLQTALNCGPGGPVPTISHGRVVAIREFAAWLYATVSPNGCTTAYQFAYGKTTGYGHRTPIVRLAAGAGPTRASEVVGGLLPNTTYHFRLIAYSGSGKTYGGDHSFKTKPAGVIRIARGPAYLNRPFVADIRLVCTHGHAGCAGSVKIFWSRQVIGQHRFFLRRGERGVVSVGLDALGRSLFRANQTLHVEVLARLKHYQAESFLTLTRLF